MASNMGAGQLFLLFIFILCYLGLGVDSRQMTVIEKIKQDPELSQFLALLERNEIANSTLERRQLTLFAPTNEAFQRYKGPQEDIVLYHMTTLATTLSELGSSVSSQMDGNPPLWVTRRHSQHHDDIYINNARVIPSRSYFYNAGKKHYLHVIDDVLVPVLPSSTASSIVYNPDAFQFMEQSEKLAIGSHRLRSYRQKVIQNKKDSIFRSDGHNTFFIPVEEGFKPNSRPDLIDGKVIDAHVIPNQVLFTHAALDGQVHQTLAFGDNLKVTLTMETERDGQDTRSFVKSNTLLGDSKHAMGVVIADIVKANIPVKNGVIHLIQRPLVVVDTSVAQFLEDKKDGPLNKFHDAIMDLGGEYFNTLTRMKDLTLFAPSNEAWMDPNLANIIRNKQKMHEILNLHVVRERLPMEKIIQNNMHKIYQVPTAVDRKYLYFNVISHGSNQTLTVEAGGVNATVIQPNIAATNGYIHIINRVLGVPYTTVLEKLRTDPMLNSTYFLGQQRFFNDQLNEKTSRFTYFVPRDLAWQKFNAEHPSAYKKLFMEQYSYHSLQILERHLVKGDRAYSMADMKLLANETHPVVLPTARDSLRLRIKESDKNYYVEWQNQWIHVFRPDVECTNGIIHVLDFPFLQESDIQVTGTAAALISMALPNILLFVGAVWLQ